MKPALVLLTLLALAACGADGEPVQPTASLYIGVGSDGVSGGAMIGVTKGPLRILWGLG